jgi:hypothetical protein
VKFCMDVESLYEQFFTFSQLQTWRRCETVCMYSDDAVLETSRRKVKVKSSGCLIKYHAMVT